MLTDSKLLFCYQSTGKKNLIPPLTQNYQGYFCSYAQLHSTEGHSLCSLVSEVSPRGMGFSISRAQCKVPTPTPLNRKRVHNVKTSDLNFDDYLVKHWLHRHSIFMLYFQFELQCNLLASQVFSDRDPASLWSCATGSAARSWEPGTQGLMVFKLNPLSCPSLLQSPHNCFSCSRLSWAFQHIWEVGKNIPSPRTEEASTGLLSTQLKEKLWVSISPRSYKAELWNQIDLEASSLCYFKQITHCL